MRKKKVVVQPVEQPLTWTDPNPDPYGFESAIHKLNSLGYEAKRESGVLMVFTDLSEKDTVLEIIHQSGFLGSWGIRQGGR